MDPATLSFAALVLAVLLSMVSKLNIGVVSIVLAWIVGVHFAGLPIAAVIGGFPLPLFLTLVGVTLLFGMASGNGTLARIAGRAVALCRGNAGLVPFVLFAVAAVLSTIGPGNIATVALLAPLAMAAGTRAGVPPFLVALMLVGGAQVGALSPFAPTGVIVNGTLQRIGLDGQQWAIFLNNAFAQVAISVTAYLAFGGWRLLARSGPATAVMDPVEPFERRHWFTIAVLAAMVLTVVLGKQDVGLVALAGATLLALTRIGDERAAIAGMPWNVVLMVCGVTVLIGVLEKTRGMELFTSALAQLSTPGSVSFVVAAVTGIVSVYSSTSGVVLPAFLPAVPGLVEQLPGVEALDVASAMVVGGHLVDLSPLSTLGALCIGAVPAGIDPRRLFNQLLAWGLSMTVIGALVCWLLF